MPTERVGHAQVGVLRGRGSLLAFFGLTFALSWIIWIPRAAVAQGVETPLAVTLAGLPQVGAFGPSVAGRG